jgi:WXG100 family type VII secretion target
MAGEKIEVDYEDLEKMAEQFGCQAEQYQVICSDLKMRLDQLMSDEWKGAAQMSFYLEMTGSVIPAVQRLGNALVESENTMRAIIKVFQEAESEAAGLINNNFPLTSVKPTPADMNKVEEFVKTLPEDKKQQLSDALMSGLDIVIGFAFEKVSHLSFGTLMPLDYIPGISKVDTTKILFGSISLMDANGEPYIKIGNDYIYGGTPRSA